MISWVMPHKHSIFKSFGFAFQGLAEAVKSGRNFRIQMLLGLISIFMAVVYKLSNYEWLILILSIAAVLILELINTSIESIVDLVSPEIKDKAKVAKDMAAGAVLVASIASIIIGGILFLPKILVGVQ